MRPSAGPPPTPQGTGVGTNQDTSVQDNDNSAPVRDHARATTDPGHDQPHSAALGRNPACPLRRAICQQCADRPAAILSAKGQSSHSPCDIQLSSPAPAELQSMRSSRRVNSVENPGACQF